MNRSYELDIFQLTPDIAIAKRSDVALYHPFGAGLIGKSWFHIRDRYWPVSSVNELDYRFDQSVLDLQPPLYLAGLWQSYRYFSHIEHTVRRDFAFRDPLPDNVASLALAVSSPGAVCLHVRRTDYVDIPQNSPTIGFIGLNYYREAVEKIRSRIDRPRFFVFSDDMTWCEENLAWLGDETVFVRYSLPVGFRGHACDMQLMSRGRNFILSNSTFAWWSAWLAGSDVSTVMVPAKWFKTRDISCADLLPPGWEKV